MGADLPPESACATAAACAKRGGRETEYRCGLINRVETETRRVELGHSGRPQRHKVTPLRTASRGATWRVRRTRDCDVDAPDANEMYRVDPLGKIHSS
jgi:hypothetical protein